MPKNALLRPSLSLLSRGGKRGRDREAKKEEVSKKTGFLFLEHDLQKGDELKGGHPLVLSLIHLVVKC